MLCWVIKFKDRLAIEPDKIHQYEIPYSYAKTKKEALEIFWNVVRKNMLQYNIQIVSTELKEVKK
jgi:hypothetical protein